MFSQIFIIHEFLRSKGFRGAGVRRTPLPKAEALTEPAGERGFAPATAVAAPAGPPFENGTLHPAETLPAKTVHRDGV